jgi:hypothetical protein
VYIKYIPFAYKELHPSSSSGQALLFGGNPFPNFVVPRIIRGSEEPKQESLPGALAWIVPSFQRSSLGPCNSPNRLFSRSFISRPHQNSPPSHQRPRFHFLLRPISSCHSLSIVLLPSSSHSQRRQLAVRCRSLATTLACLTRVTVLDNNLRKPAFR